MRTYFGTRRQGLGENDQERRRSAALLICIANTSPLGIPLSPNSIVGT